MSELSDDELKDLARQQAESGPQPGEVWQHYKGSFCVVVCRSIREDTHEPLVTYRSNANGAFWTRPVGEFLPWFFRERD